MGEKSKKVGSESHVYDKHGNLEGLYTIDGKKVRQVYGEKRFWDGVDEIIRLYKQLNPSEFQYAIIENTHIRKDNKNQFGGNESGSFRQALNLPFGLYLVLTDFEQTLFRNKKTRTEFMKRYPVLRSCEVV